MMSSYIFNELQITVLFLLYSIFEGKAFLRKKNDLSHSEIHKIMTHGITPGSIVTIYFK